MPTTYSTSLRLSLMATGEQAGNWGTITNTNLGTLLEQAICGYVSVAVSGAGDTTLTSLNGATDEARNMVVNLTGSPGLARNLIVPTAPKVYLIRNATSGGYAMTVKTSAGTGVAVAAGDSVWVYCDGTNVVQGGAAYNVSTNSIDANITGTTATFGQVISPIVGAASGSSLSLNANGATKVTIDTSGNVGIGTATPAAQLDVNGTNVIVQAKASSGYGAVVIDSATGSITYNIFKVNGIECARMYSAASYLAFAIGSSPAEQMRIGSSGVSIGTTALATNAVASVNGTMTFGDSASYTTMSIGNDFGGNTLLTLAEGSSGMRVVNSGNSTEHLRITSAGDVGIGVAAPTQKLDVAGIIKNNNEIRTQLDNTLYSLYNTAGSQYGNLQGTSTKLVLSAGTAASNTFTINTNSSERVRVDSSGNVGIGNASPVAALDVKGRVRSSIGTGTGTGGAGYSLYEFGSSATATENWQIGSDGDGTFRFYNQAYGSGVERMRLTAAGLMTLSSVSQIQNGLLSLNTPPATNGIGINVKTSYTGIITDNIAATAVYNFAGFMQQGVVVGSIGVSTTSTSYNTSSDYRLKQNASPITNALNTISALNPVSYTWKSTGERGNGFIAHELQAVIPEAVTGEKDAVNDDGTIKPQGVDYSKIVVHLVAALQELKDEFDAYKASHP